MKVFVHPAIHLEGVIDPPSSKNYTLRYVLASALAEGESEVLYPAQSDDAAALLECLSALGAGFRREGECLKVRGFGANPQEPRVLNPRNAGAVLRMLLGVAALLPETRFETEFADSLGRRPNRELLEALAQLGATYKAGEDGRLPIVLRGGNLHGGKVKVSGARSSQFLSSLLFLSPLIGERVEIQVTDELVSVPLIRTTLEVLQKAGIAVQASRDLRRFGIPKGQKYKPGHYDVNGDYPGSAAIMAAAATNRGDVTIRRLFEDQQGEQAAVDVLDSMQADVYRDGRSVRVRGGRLLRAVRFDGDEATDAVLALVGAACLAAGESVFYNIGNLRLKECDRIHDSITELRKIGVECDETPDSIVVKGSPTGYEGGLEVEAHNDHRVIMLLTIVGLRCRKGLTIRDAQHVGKSYPRFFDDLRLLGAQIEEMPD